MIRRFLAGSILVHGLVLGLGLLRPPPAAPALAALQMHLIGPTDSATASAEARSSAQHERPAGFDPRDRPPLGRAETRRPAIASSDTGGSAGGDGGTAALANHLQARLHALLDQHFVYPPLARRHGWQGRVELAVRMEPDGHMQALRVARSSGYAVLDQDALITLQRIGALPQARAGLSGCACELRLAVVYRLIEG